MERIKIISSDLNGTLVHQHTMSDMIQLYLEEERFTKAKAVFGRQTNGKATIAEAFSIAGLLTKGLTLRQAIEYARDCLEYVLGFKEFTNAISQKNKHLVINSTGYSVTIYIIMELVGAGKICGQIGNYLKFGRHGYPRRTLSENDLKFLVKKFFINPSLTKYDEIKATGEIELGIKVEADKANLIRSYVRENFQNILPNQIAHMGDTIGDSQGILQIAQGGGVGIAFNYNESLANFLLSRKSSQIKGEIHLIDPKNPNSNLKKYSLY